MSQTPGLWGRLLARIEGEVPADTLEAYRRAGVEVYDALQQVEDRRLELKLQNVDPWSVEPATQAQFLCTWNAFALQTLGDQFLEADYRLNPATVGYVPPITARQALAFYKEVEGWVNRAQRARSNPEYRLDVAVPADLPAWEEVDPCPRAHLEAMRVATRELQGHAEAALAVFQIELASPDRQRGARRLHELLAEATAKSEYAQRLWTPGVSQTIHEAIERHFHEALAGFYRLGQLLAMPGLLDQAPRTPRAERGSGPARLPLPGEPGFDPWCLTDPLSRKELQRDKTARAAIAALWDQDPDPRRTLAIHQEIEAARARGDIDYATTSSGGRLGHYYCCPWSPVYTAKRPVQIAGRSLRPLEEFTYDVSAEGPPKGEPFRREISVASFRPSSEIDYCLPGSGNDE